MDRMNAGRSIRFLFTIMVTTMLTTVGCDRHDPNLRDDFETGQLSLTNRKSLPSSSTFRMSTSKSDPQEVADRYIVVFKKALVKQGIAGQSATETSTKIRATHGGQIIHTYQHALHGMAIKMSKEAAERMKQDDRVAYIEPDRMVKLNNSQLDATWGLDRIDQRQLPLNQTFNYWGQGGEGVHAYVIDTGIYAGHSEFLAANGTSRVGVGYDFADNDAEPEDCIGHGTHVAGTLAGTTYGVAKKATLHALRVIGCGGSTITSSLIAAVDWVTANRVLPAVANMSLGVDPSQALDEAVTASIAAGVVYVVSAGNNGGDACLQSPARVTNAITVGATDSTDSRRSNSNYGPCVDIFAPGENITSAWTDSPTATYEDSGTSMASPHVAGAAALWLGLHPTATPAAVEQALTLRATADIVSDPGSGSPNFLLYTGNMTGEGSTPYAYSMGVSPNPTEGGTPVVGIFRLSEVAPPGGVTVALSSDDPLHLALPAMVFIPAGEQGVRFPATTVSSPLPLSISLSASYPNQVTVSSPFVLAGSPTVTSIVFTPSPVESGLTSTATVTLSHPAPDGGALIALHSSDTGIATVPANLTIPAGSREGTFEVNTLLQSHPTTVTISASYHQLTKSANLEVSAVPHGISSIEVTPTAIEGGQGVMVYIRLNNYAPVGGTVVLLTSSDPSVVLPSSITIPSGYTSQTLSIPTLTVTTQVTSILTATYPVGLQKSANLVIGPSPTPKSLSLSPLTVTGGNQSTATILLTGPAPAGGATVLLTSSATEMATVPASVTVPAGSNQATFTVMTLSQITDRSVTISASYHGISVSEVLSVRRPLPVGNAVYDSDLFTPKCGVIGSYCDSGGLIDGRGFLLGPEENHSNNISYCGDGLLGKYHVDESLDRLKISTLDGSNLAPGKAVRVEATVWASRDSDAFDLYLSTNPSTTSSTWTLLTANPITTTLRGTVVLAHEFTLPVANGSMLWAIRGVFRRGGEQTDCPTTWEWKNYNDVDDLAFVIQTSNTPPVVNAGADLSVFFNTTANLLGTVTDDGLPNPPSRVTTTWSKVSGPGNVTFTDKSALGTLASFTLPGTYTLRLTAHDGSLSSYDQVVVTVRGPCAGVCANPVSFTWRGSYQSGSIGTGKICRETLHPIVGGNCGNFAGGRTLSVNGTVMPCNAQNWSSIPSPVAGGYCITTTTGNYSWAFFALW